MVLLEDIKPATGMLMAVAVYVLILLLRRYHQLHDHDDPSKDSDLGQAGEAVHGALPTPECVLATLPVIGHVVKYVKHGHRYFSTLCASTTLPIFTIRMAAFRVSIIKPALTRALPKVKHLTLGALVVEIFQRSLDLHPSSCALLKEEDERSKTFAPALSRLFREELLPIENVRRHLGKLDGFIVDQIARLGGRQEVLLEQTMFNIFVGALGKLLWAGNDGPFADPSFLGHLRILLLNIQQLANPATFMIKNSLLASRRIVRDFLTRFGVGENPLGEGWRTTPTSSSPAATGEQPAPSCEFLGRVRALCERHGAAADGWTDHQLLLIFGLVPNVAAASTWMMHHLLADPALLRVVRSEIDAAVAAASLTPSSFSSCGNPSVEEPHMISLAALEKSCPHLIATWYEVLRFRGGFTVGRFVHADTPLAGKYLLQRGTFLLAPLRPHHFDVDVWGEDAEVFRPERWLISSEPRGRTTQRQEMAEMEEKSERNPYSYAEESKLRIDAGLVKKLKVYGVFGSLCPGRFLAMHFAVLGIVQLLLRYEVSPVDQQRKHVLPEECKDTLVGVVTPATDAEVRLLQRPTWRPIRFDLQEIGQGI